MAKQHSYPPFYNDESQQAAENLRLALPLINKHKSPVTPANYAVWYEYVSGDNLELSNAIDTILSNNGAITTEMSQYLYEKYVLMGMPERLESANNGLKLVVDNTLININHVESTANQCLSGFSDSQMALETCTDIDDLKSLLGDILSETQKMSDSSNELKLSLEQSSEEIEQLKAELQAVKESTQTDVLTGLLNQGAFNHELNNLCQHDQACHSAALVLFDIDNFKQINDSFGHVLGDRVLQFFAELLKGRAGRSPIIARYSGKQMALLLINKSLQQATATAEEIRAQFANSRIKRRQSDDSIGQVTVSVGISMMNNGDSARDFVDRTDSALSLSKDNGHNQVNIA